LTAFISGTIGSVQNDIKKIIAYSTCSQLGYMVLACGLSQYSVSFFHLFNHAFFKALLFLSAGSVIHLLNNEQDIRRMGGLGSLSPFLYVSFLISSLALAGFPFLSGFFSKDVIIEISNIQYSINGTFLY
jgi:NADH-ubiquinone oxidoreductase chain 5